MSTPSLLLRSVRCIVYAAMAGVTCAADPHSFDSFARPFLETHCFDCHDAETKKGDFALDELAAVTAENMGEWYRIWEQVSIKEMPPKKKGQPEAMARHHFTQWLIKEFDRVKEPEGGFHAHELPEKGNHVDHELLFGPVPEGLEPTSTPARTWRIHPEAYLVRINELVHKMPAYDPARHGALATGQVPASSKGGLKTLFLGWDRAGPSASKSMVNLFPPLALRSAPGLRDYPTLYSIDSPETNQVLEDGMLLLKYMMYDYNEKTSHKGAPLFKQGVAPPLSPLVDMYGSSTNGSQPSRKMVESCVRFLFDKWVYRPPTDRELGVYADNAAKSIEKLGVRQGAVVGLAPVFLHPEALFRHELVEKGQPDQYGRVMMQDEELARSLFAAFSYLPPDTTLRKAVKDGKMRSREDVAREVKRILDDDAIHKARVLYFFQSYFDYPLATEIGKDDVARKRHGSNLCATIYLGSVSRMVNNTNALILYILRKDQDVLKELLTTRLAVTGIDGKKTGRRSRTDINKKWEQTIDTPLYAVFDGTGKPGSREEKRNLTKKRIHQAFQILGEPVLNNDTKKGTVHVTPQLGRKVRWLAKGARELHELPKDKWCGLLTQPAWLIAQSDATDNHAIHRGKWVLERLLGGGVADIPVTVDAMLPDEPDSTLRHRMRKTKEKYCWKCHRKMDPVGLLFENYNHVGFFRTQEQGAPIDTSGEIIDSADPALNRKYKDAIEMISVLAESEHVHQVFVRHAFRFWMGRNETIDDAPVLQAAYRSYKDNGGSMKALITSLLTSDAFLYRKRMPSNKPRPSERTEP